MCDHRSSEALQADAARRRSTSPSRASAGTRRRRPSLTVSSSPAPINSYTNVRPHPRRCATSITDSRAADAVDVRGCAPAAVAARLCTPTVPLSDCLMESKSSSACAMRPMYPGQRLHSAYSFRVSTSNRPRCAAQSDTHRHLITAKRCAACGGPLPERSGQRSRPARFCSDACRAAAYRRRRQHECESLPRWPHARGTLRLSDAAEWEAEQRKAEHARRKAGEDRARQAAWNRARKQWRHARAVADRLRVLYGTPAPTLGGQAAWRAIAEAAEACARIGVPGMDWAQELANADRRAAELEPPHLTRAEHRRRQRAERKARPTLPPSGGVGQLPPVPSWAVGPRRIPAG